MYHIKLITAFVGVEFDFVNISIDAFFCICIVRCVFCCVNINYVVLFDQFGALLLFVHQFWKVFCQNIFGRI